jgi:hypothetical protein
VVYRSAAYELGETPHDPRQALVSLVRGHVAASGPVSRRDLAWWSGAGLRRVDEALSTLADELVARPGPDGLDYVDLAEGPPAGAGVNGVRLLPEYDALLIGYDPPARARFADAVAIELTWNRSNGVHSPTVLVDGRLRGRWRLARTAGAATIAVEMFPGERHLEPSELSEAVAALGTALGIPVADVRVGRIPD